MSAWPAFADDNSPDKPVDMVQGYYLDKPQVHHPAVAAGLAAETTCPLPQPG